MKSITRVGIDVSKDWLDVQVDRPQAKQLRLSNDLVGVGQLKSDLGAGEYVIAVEATGRYEALAVHELEAAGYTVRVKNPRQIRRLAHGLGIAAKTDVIDANLLAQTAELGPPVRPRSEEREALGDLSRTIACLMKDRSKHLKRMKVPGFSSEAISALTAVVQAIDVQVKELKLKFVQLVKRGSFARRYALLLGVRGVGPCLARIAVCELPENIQDWSVRQLSSYAGVAAMDHSSGNKTSNSHVHRHGNSHLKAGLYMPAVALLATQPWAKQTYSRLTGKGRTHQQAMVAIMHKLLIHMVAVIKRGSPWQAEPPKA